MTPRIALKVFLALSILNAPLTHGALVVSTGNINLFADTSDQIVELFFQNTGSAVDVTGLDLYIQVADGGPEVPEGSIDGPVITAIDLLTGTVFDGQAVFENTDNTYPQSKSGSLALVAPESSVTIPSTGSPSLKLATVTFDTSGFSDFESSWDLILETTALGVSTFYDVNIDPIPISADPGTIVLIPIPEPSEYAMLVAFGLGGFAFVRKRLINNRRVPFN
jgi:hypothetical protein